MEALGVLLGLGLMALLLVGPILGLIAFVRSNRLKDELRNVRADLGALESRVAGLVKSLRAERARPEAPAEAPLAPAPAPAPTTGVAAAPTPAPPPVTAVPPSRPAEPPVTVRAPAVPQRAASLPTSAAETAVPPAPPSAPVPSVPAGSPVAPPPAAGAPAARPAARPAGAPPPPRPPRTTPPPGPPPAPAFEWESLLGIKGAAWLGGIMIVIAGVFFAKWAIDQGFFTPERRIAVLLLAGVGSLVWAELSLRRGFETTANSVSGAGIAILYVAFFAGHSLYGLFSLGLTFAMMVLVTVVAGLLAVRYDAMYTAVLGLLGGFATPILLSTGRDNPVGLFSYVLLLNLGLMAVARHRRWHGLVLLSLAGTLVIEVGWFGRFMTPEKMVVGLAAFLLFGLLYLFLPLVSEDQEQERLVQAGAIGGIAPFLFAVLLAGQRAYSGEWPLLFGFLGLLDAALIAVALLRGRVALLVSASLATAITLPIWAAQGLGRERLWGPTLGAIALVALLNLPKRLARYVGGDAVAQQHANTLQAAGLLAGAGLGLFALVFLAHDLGEPPWAFLVLAASLVALLLERTGADRLPGVMVLGSGAVAILIQAWFFRSTAGDVVLRNLGVPLLLAIGLSIVSAVRHRASGGGTSRLEEDEGGAVVAVLVAIAGLFGCLGSSALGSDPRPLFAALGVLMVLLVASALRRDWTILLPVGLASSALFATAWHGAYFRRTDLGAALLAYVLLYLAFLALPFAVPEPAASRWRRHAAPWVASALAGPAFFFVLYDTWQQAWGKGAIGALPVLQAALSTVALAGVSRVFAPRAADRETDGLRLRYLALFSALALGFVTAAIPIQLDRQWITIGWALEATAVWWLYGRLPHWGLRRLGALLFAMVGARLLFNMEVFRYQERGLPILNWLLYTYGVPALCCFVGAWMLRRSAEREDSGESAGLASAASFLGLILVFALINLEIFDYYSSGRYLEFSFERRFARDLTISVAWGLYAMGLLVLGLWRGVKALRFVSLGFLILTVGKVFLYDLAALEGLYRILSFLGLGISLILVSLLYQRFVFSREGSS